MYFDENIFSKQKHCKPDFLILTKVQKHNDIHINFIAVKHKFFLRLIKKYCMILSLPLNVETFNSVIAMNFYFKITDIPDNEISTDNSNQ